MIRKRTIILPIATALASLSTGLVSASAATNVEANVSEPATKPAEAEPANTFFKVGEDLLGFLVTEQADGTVVAQHRSHYSHSSHSSHRSHYSSRY